MLNAKIEPGLLSKCVPATDCALPSAMHGWVVLPTVVEFLIARWQLQWVTESVTALFLGFQPYTCEAPAMMMILLHGEELLLHRTVAVGDPLDGLWQFVVLKWHIAV